MFQLLKLRLSILECYLFFEVSFLTSNIVVMSARAPKCYLNTLVELEKLLCWAVGHTLAASFESLARQLNVGISKSV